MIDILFYSFNAVAPIIGLIIVGNVAFRMGLLDDHTLKTINRFNYRFCFFCMMFINIYQMESFQDVPWGLMLATIAVLVILTAVGWAISNVATERRDRKGTLIQALFRSNYAVIGLILAEALAGERGVQMAAFFQLPGVIYFNVMSAVALSVYSDVEDGNRVEKTVKGILKNPLILGLGAGALAVLIRGFIPTDASGVPVLTLSGNFPWAYQIITYLSKIATPMALIVLGGQLTPGEVKGFRKELIYGVLMKLVLAPALGMSLVVVASRLGWFELDTASAAVLISIFGSPAAVTSTVMAAEMGADDKFAGQLVVWTSILGMGTMFVCVFLLRTLGLL